MFRKLKNWWILFRGGPIDLWLDDVRPAPSDWYWAINAWEARDVLESNIVRHCSLDHDLGEFQWTGYDLLNWLAHMWHENDLNLWPENRPRVHSQNPVGRFNMLAVIEHDGPYQT